MNALELAKRFLAADWKELDTAFRVQRGIRHERDSFPSDSAEYKTLNSMFYELERIIYKIAELTPGILPNHVYANTVLLPRVAWLPQPIFDEESGIATRPPMPELPDFESKADRCHYLKQLADASLEEKHEWHNEEQTVDDQPKVIEQTEEQPVEQVVADDEYDSSCEQSQVMDELRQQEEQPTPAQQAIAAIRSRRKKKTNTDGVKDT